MGLRGVELTLLRLFLRFVRDCVFSVDVFQWKLFANARANSEVPLMSCRVEQWRCCGEKFCFRDGCVQQGLLSMCQKQNLVSVRP